ncbi:hypothetical protein PACTADRAFT_75027 [Pachysolen tannophilus NRRL Y-2460]|uniref:Ribosomal RNA-processing protein 41 n=1 Tax=Pachysolen tannophilus NRRL Y-2460 TaxID=669874 RepID=A0A1E4TVP1_PACTA|nr:hypothetical protein PACTADRAFT_75027 [Pachysolen tannophilus NRRL Y-2460]
MEVYSPEGLRADGRRWNEVRNFKCHINTHQNSSDGSSYVEMGNTKVVCLVSGPMESPSSGRKPNSSSNLTVSISMPSFVSNSRKKFKKNDKRIQELCIFLVKTFEQIVIMKNYPRTIISISIVVLSQDGGLLPSCVNAITLALIDAGISMYDYVSSINVGLYDTTPLLDLNHLEENDLSFLTLGVVGKSEKISLLLLEDKLSLDNLEKLLAIGIVGCHRIRDIMDQEIRRHGNLRLSKITNK